MRLRAIPRLVLASVVALGCLAGLLAPAAHADTLPGNLPRVFPASAYGDGCGLAGLHPLPDQHVFADPLPWFFFPVNFRAACDMHDAGYAGGIVADPVNGGTVDTRRLSRQQVDAKFLSDLMTQCTQQVPWLAGVAMSTCFGIASTYYGVVRGLGFWRFDADPTTPGWQPFGPRPNN